MKCLICGEDLFPRQITCHRCGTMVAIAEAMKAKKTEEKPPKKKKQGEINNGK